MVNKISKKQITRLLPILSSGNYKWQSLLDNFRHLDYNDSFMELINELPVSFTIKEVKEILTIIMEDIRY